MINILSVFVFLSLNLFAQSTSNKLISFDEFLDNALQNSPYLKSLDLNIHQASLEGEVLTRYENPSLDLAFSEFKSNSGQSDTGYKMAIAQPIRLWGIGDAKENLATSIKKNSQASYFLSRAKFSKNIASLFTQYAQKKELYALAKEELNIASRIYDVSQARFEVGTISQGEMLQAKVDFEMIGISIDAIELSYREQYFELLEVAGYSKEIALNHKHTFEIFKDLELASSPEIEYIQSSKELASAKAKINSHQVESIDVHAEYEDEPDQNIMRLGLSVPLAIFNTKKQEQQIAKLEYKKNELYMQKQSDKVLLSVSKLRMQRDLLEKLHLKNETILRTQERLLGMYEEAYKIAKIKLLELQNIKNQVIKTKESLIQIKFALDLNAINSNYILGVYNE